MAFVALPSNANTMIRAPNQAQEVWSKTQCRRIRRRVEGRRKEVEMAVEDEGRGAEAWGLINAAPGDFEYASDYAVAVSSHNVSTVKIIFPLMTLYNNLLSSRMGSVRSPRVLVAKWLS